MATHSTVFAWRILGTGEPGGCRLWGCTESDMTEATQQQQQHRLVGISKDYAIQIFFTQNLGTRY